MHLLQVARASPPAPDGPAARWLKDPAAFNRWLAAELAGLLSFLAPYLLGALVVLLGASLCLLSIRALAARSHSGSGRHLRILPPPEVDPDGAVTLWMALHALIRPWWRRIVSGQPHLAWELAADGQEAEIHLWVPRLVPPGLVERAVESAWPGARVEQGSALSQDREETATCACELVLAEPAHFPLGAGAGKDPLRVALGALTLLDSKERALIQILARPVTSMGRRRMWMAARRLRRRSNASLISRPKASPPRPPADPVLDQDVRAILS
ncbi:MAG: type VI secretion protein, partial [Actinomycetota bacterium]